MITSEINNKYYTYYLAAAEDLLKYYEKQLSFSFYSKKIKEVFIENNQLNIVFSDGTTMKIDYMLFFLFLSNVLTKKYEDYSLFKMLENSIFPTQFFKPSIKDCQSIFKPLSLKVNSVQDTINEDRIIKIKIDGGTIIGYKYDILTNLLFKDILKKSTALIPVNYKLTYNTALPTVFYMAPETTIMNCLKRNCHKFFTIKELASLTGYDEKWIDYYLSSIIKKNNSEYSLAYPFDETPYCIQILHFYSSDNILSDFKYRYDNKTAEKVLKKAKQEYNKTR